MTDQEDKTIREFLDEFRAHGMLVEESIIRCVTTIVCPKTMKGVKFTREDMLYMGGEEKIKYLDQLLSH